MLGAIWEPGVRFGKKAARPTKRVRSLPLEAAIQYGLLGRDYVATDLAKRLADLDEATLYGEFARHILLRGGGLRVVEGVHEMVRQGMPVTGDTLAVYLSNQGFRVSVHNTAINSLRLWLEKGGVFLRAWEVNQARVDELLGVNRADVAGLVGLDEDQRAFLIALCRINPRGPVSAAVVRDLAEQSLSRMIPRDSLPKRVLEALRDLGYIEYASGGTSGGKAARLSVTPKFNSQILGPFMADAVASLDPLLTRYFATTPADIYADLDSPHPGKRGRALEAYAVHVMRLMGFRFVGWRKRAVDSTGNAEVDVLMRGLFGNSPTRWQIQCKNTPMARVDLEDVAKEVGLVPLTNATHILIIANSQFTKDARHYASEVMRATPLTIFLLGKEDFDAVKATPGALATILYQQANYLSLMGRRTTMWGW